MKVKTSKEGLPRQLQCDNCGKTLLYIIGNLNIELHDLINNNTRYIDNTEILCSECLDKKLNKKVTK